MTEEGMLITIRCFVLPGVVDVAILSAEPRFATLIGANARSILM